MCGGDIDCQNDNYVVECEYCLSRQTIPKLDDEKKIRLFSKAESLRKMCEFDKASNIYSNIIAEYPEEAEGYWGILLCKYGIEYVDDYGGTRKVPTCHRSSFSSILDDDDYDMVLECSEGEARRQYREEAKEIEQIRKGIVEVSSKEQPYDIFICYKETDENGDRTQDSVYALEIYDELVSKGYRVFFSRISLESKLGTEYEPYIFAALNSAKIMLVLGTEVEHFSAVWVKNEWKRFLNLIEKGDKKTLIPCYWNMSIDDLPKEFRKLQAVDMNQVGAKQELIRGIRKIYDISSETVYVENNNIKLAEEYFEKGKVLIHDRKFEEGIKSIEESLDYKYDNCEAYVYLIMARLNVSSQEELEKISADIRSTKNLKMALSFANESRRQEIEKLAVKMYLNMVLNKIESSSLEQLESLGKYIDEFTDESDIEVIKKSIEETKISLTLKGVDKYLEEADNEKKVDIAIELLHTIESIFDISGKLVECEEKRKEVIYNECIELLENKQFFSLKNWKEVLKLCETIQGYKDVDEIRKKCVSMISSHNVYDVTCSFGKLIKSNEIDILEVEQGIREIDVFNCENNIVIQNDKVIKERREQLVTDVGNLINENERITEKIEKHETVYKKVPINILLALFITIAGIVYQPVIYDYTLGIRVLIWVLYFIGMIRTKGINKKSIISTLIISGFLFVYLEGSNQLYLYDSESMNAIKSTSLTMYFLVNNIEIVLIIGTIVGGIFLFKEINRIKKTINGNLEFRKNCKMINDNLSMIERKYKEFAWLMRENYIFCDDLKNRLEFDIKEYKLVYSGENKN